MNKKNDYSDSKDPVPKVLKTMRCGGKTAYRDLYISSYWLYSELSTLKLTYKVIYDKKSTNLSLQGRENRWGLS